MKRTLALAAAVGLSVAGLAAAPAQAAVTNPADNPHPITVKGDDGKTYTDGEDTLPGYDDQECTYIPGAWFDFANDRVHYPDGQSIPWTEWDRATGYAKWKASQGQGGGGGSTPSQPSTGEPGKTGGSSSGGSTGAGTGGSKSSSSTKKKRGSKSSSSVKKSGSGAGSGASPNQAGTTQVGDAGDAATDPAVAATDRGGKGGPDASGAPTDPAATAPVTEGSPQALAADSTTDLGETTAAASTDEGGRGAAGLIVLVALGAVGVLALAGGSLLGRLRRDGSAS